MFASVTLGVAQAQWLSLPSPEAIAAAYPRAARDAGVVGRAELSCAVGKDGRLSDCRVGMESPAGDNFGLAAMSLTPAFQMDVTTPLGTAAMGKRIRIPVRFGLPAGEPPLRGARFKESGQYAKYAPAGPYWPDRALRMNASGFVAVNCFVASDQRLKNCRVATADGAEFGFPDSVLKMAEQGWMTAAPLEPGAPSPPDGVWRFEVSFPARRLGGF
ncbi:TonB family protein [Phenylobacterium sp.]|uniref:TonB family protein n=1 Tax=Phenylobacterium sp. TaxID=1871053 RepID=UPI0025FF61A4|nr:TonB family protein [Phenylobacterium sp.]